MDYIEEAYKESLKSLKDNEIPIGAVIVMDGEIISSGHNTKEKTLDITGHAEIMAIKKAAKKLGSWQLKNCIIYTTLEPCLMCFEAIKQSHIKEVYYGAKNNKVINLKVKLNNTISVKCSQLLKNYFKTLR